MPADGGLIDAAVDRPAWKRQPRQKTIRALEGGSQSTAPQTVLRAGPDVLTDSSKRVGGRPSSYSTELAASICDRIGSGESLDMICKDAGMPAVTTVTRWVINDHEGFYSEYMRARQQQAWRWSEDITVIADDQTADPNDRRVRIDARKWLLSKVLPKVFGDKIIHSGDQDNPIVVLHKRAAIDELSVTELATLEQFTSARLEATDLEPEDGNSK